MSQFFASMRFAPCSELDRFTVGGGWLETLWNHKLYRESFAPGAFLVRSGAPIFEYHDGPRIGEIVIAASHGTWWVADAVIDDTPLNRSLVKPGARVSLESRSINRREDLDLRIVRHTTATLDGIALVRECEVPGYIGAKVTHVREVPKSAPAAAASPMSVSAGVVMARTAMHRSRCFRGRDGAEMAVEAGPTSEAFIAGLLRTGYAEVR